MWADLATIWTVLLPWRQSNWENSTWIDFIPHSVHSKYFWQRHMAKRSAQQRAVQPRAWAVFAWSFQATCTFWQATYAMFVCRQAGRHTRCALVQTQMINLCRTTNILPSHFAPNSFPVCHNVYTCNNTHCFMPVTYFITLFVSRPQHCMPDVCCNVSGRKQLHLGHPVYGRTNQWEIVFHLQSIWDGQNQPDVPGFC